MCISKREGARVAALALLLAALPAAPAAAQSPSTPASGTPTDCEVDLSEPVYADDATSGAARRGNASPAAREAPAAQAKAAPTEAEERVRAIIAEPGVHVVRLWAPWCKNSTGEMADGWDRLLAENPNVTFTFVTVWNNGRSGAGTIQRYGLSGERITEVVPADPEQGRLDAFMGYALDWVPSTWIFRTEEAGEAPQRAFALNYGETDAATLQTLLEAARADW